MPRRGDRFGSVFPSGERRGAAGAPFRRRRPRTSLLALVLALAGAAVAQPLSFSISGGEPGSWPGVLSSIGLLQGAAAAVADVVVLRDGATGTAAPWLARAETGGFVVLEGASPLAESFGFRPSAKKVRVQSITDVHRPDLRIIWERGVDVPVFDLPAQARVFARDRWTGAPLIAGFRHGRGAVLWTAAAPGATAYERFPYIPAALHDLGLALPFQSRRIWAFFDSSYRVHVDLEYFARRWRRAGIAALHVAAWHFFEPDEEQDDYLRRLIAACHRNGITIYAWLELPHVSEKFWDDHPEWREKTAVLQDARLDWRKLMNLVNRDCHRAISEGVRRLMNRFDWDGVNLAELYFESPFGIADPSRFTPLNDDVRRAFAQERGFDPIELFRPGGADPVRVRAFLDYRADLAGRLQAEWMAEFEAMRRVRRDFDIVLTHVDDRFDTSMRDTIGADVTRVLPLLDKQDFTFLIEDPGTIWHLGPQRYPEIAAKYRPLTGHQDKLAIDINVVERYQDVYPTKLQTGTELFQLVYFSSAAFARVALYFENSILAPDLPLLPAAAATVTRAERIGDKLAIDSRYGTGVAWTGDALVDGRPWPVSGDGMLWLPAGAHTIEPSLVSPPARVLDLNAELESAGAGPTSVEVGYRSSSRALARLDRKPSAIEIDGAAAQPHVLQGGGVYTVLLPRGQHVAEFFFCPAK